MNQESYRTVLENLPTGVYVVDCDRRILFWNREAEELTGYLQQEVIGRCCRDDLLVHCDENEVCLCATACPLQQSVRNGSCRSANVFLRHRDGHRMPVEVRVVPLRDEGGTIIGAIEWFDRRQVLPPADPLVRSMCAGVSRDKLTGLPDRAAMLDLLAACLKRYHESRVPFGVLSIGVDRLEQVRRSGGANAVEALLYGTAETLASSMGPEDIVGRWSEERFVAIVSGCTASTLRRSAMLMRRLVQLEGVPWWGDRIRGAISISGAIAQDEDTAEGLAGRAEAALAWADSLDGDQITAA